MGSNGNGATGTEAQHGQQLDGLRRGNAAAVLWQLRTHGALSRSELAANVGLSAAAITKITSELERVELVRDVAPTEPQAGRGRGRPRRPVELDPDRRRAIGVHIGLRRVTVGLVDMRGELVALRTRKHTSTSAGPVLRAASKLVGGLLASTEVARDRVVGYGVCTGGWVHHATGTVQAFDGLGWRDVKVSSALAVPGLPHPRLESTVRALAVAEARLASRSGAENVLYLFVGNVVGSAHVVAGRIARGRQDAAGLIDHVGAGTVGEVECRCGRSDCLWAVVSDAALTLAAQRRGLLPEGSSIEELVRLSETDGAAAAAANLLLEQRAERAGRFLAAMIDVIDPDLVVVGGGDLAFSQRHFAQLVAAVRQPAGPASRSAPVTTASLQGPTGLVRGAAAPALDAFYANPFITT